MNANNILSFNSLNGAINIEGFDRVWFYLSSFNSLNGAINIARELKHHDEFNRGFNSLNGAINIGSKFR